MKNELNVLNFEDRLIYICKFAGIFEGFEKLDKFDYLEIIFEVEDILHLKIPEHMVCLEEMSEFICKEIDIWFDENPSF